MPAGSVQVTLPNSMQIVVQSFANGSMQRVTITLHGQQPIVFTGAGSYDTLIGSQVITTPAGQGGVVTTVAVDHSQDGHTWQPSQVDWNDCVIQYYQLIAVASEYDGDNKWDDATTYFTWTVPPEPPTIH